MINKVLCTAPLTAALVDTNKGVRPCCVYDSKYIGNIKNESIISIINSAEWKHLKNQMYLQEWPTHCLPCKEREQSTGWSVRKLFLDGSFDVSGWEEEKLTYLEFNGSNICNLACLHCAPGFSSRWVIDNTKAIKIWNTFDQEKQDRTKNFDAVIKYTDDINSRSTKMHLPDPELILRNLNEIDLSQIKTINFKGGEPFLNEETTIILEHLLNLNILKNVKIVVSTNGTFMTEKIINLLKECKTVNINLSVDGIGDLFNYIRYGDAKFDSLEPTIEMLNQLENVDIRCQTAVMNYNIFNLYDIKNWAKSMSQKYKKFYEHAGFANCVQSPGHLSLTTLSDTTRADLLKLYQDSFCFDQVINALSQNFSGNAMHNQWVDYTLLMQEVRNNNIIDIVPQLKNELVYFQ